MIHHLPVFSNHQLALYLFKEANSPSLNFNGHKNKEYPLSVTFLQDYENAQLNIDLSSI